MSTECTVLLQVKAENVFFPYCLCHKSYSNKGSKH